MRRYPAGTVLAAGALVWRVKGGELQVLAVHRPRYDDWSWPKGKLDKGETLPGCAVREVAEETGKEVILGQPLPTLRYEVSGGRTKVVRYWAAQVAPKSSKALLGRPRVKDASKNEIDTKRWLTIDEARRLITFSADLVPLERLVQLHEKGRLDTTALVIARHARARRRQAWTGKDLKRPLTKGGAVRALALRPLFAAYGCTRVDSSPATRTLATVKPYAKAIGTKVKELPPLTEEAHASNPLGTATIMTSLLGKHVNRVVCVHRPTLPTVIEMVRKATRHYTEGTLPTKNPYLPAGGVLVAHVIQTERGPRVVSVERHLLKPEA